MFNSVSANEGEVETSGLSIYNACHRGKRDVMHQVVPSFVHNVKLSDKMVTLLWP